MDNVEGQSLYICILLYCFGGFYLIYRNLLGQALVDEGRSPSCSSRVRLVLVVIGVKGCLVFSLTSISTSKC